MSDNIDDSRRDQWERERKHRRDINRQPPAGGGGNGPHLPGMEQLVARVDGLEKWMDRVETKLDSIDTRLRVVEGDLREIKGTLITLTNSVVGKLPSWWQVPLGSGALVTLILALLGLAAKMGLFNHH